VAARSLRTLVFTRTTGFRHPSIADAWRVLGALPPDEELDVTLTEDPTRFTEENLATYDVVLFVNTTGDVLDAPQQAAMEGFIRAGGGYVGVHSAADTEYDWPWYGRLVGAYFRSHPLLPVNVVTTTEEERHPATAHLPPTFHFTDEIYNFDRNPRLDHTILLTIDEAGFTFPNFPIGAPSMGADHPIAWLKEFEGGRSFYTNLGHRPETWDDARFRRHLLEGIRWAAAPIAYNAIELTGEPRNPMMLAVAPDGRVFWIERTGELRVWHPGTGRVTDAAVFPVDTEAENGLLGLALDPGFSQNRRLWLYRSVPISDPPPATGPPGENVLSHFTLRDDGTVDPASEVRVLAVPSERACCHEGGGIAFAPDGSVFLSTGDNSDPFSADGFAPLDERPGHERGNSQRTAANPFDLRGKILRIRPDGTAPPGNLFPPSGTLGRPEIFTMGNRNPYRIAIDGQTGRLWWGEIGPDAFEDTARGPRGFDEINFADVPGHYGWPFCIADGVPYPKWDYTTETPGPLFDCTGFVPPLFAYDYLTTSHLALGNFFFHSVNAISGRAAMAGIVYRASPGAPFALPAPFDGRLLMNDWTRDVIAAVELRPDDTLDRLTRFLPWRRFHRPIDLDAAGDGALYVLEYGTGYFGDNEDARITRIEHSPSGDLTPMAAIEASPTSGPAPLTVRLSANGSRAAGHDGGIAGYAWDLDGDGRADFHGATIERTYRRPGRYPVSLVVTADSGDRSFPAVTDIVVGNSPPVVTITSHENNAVIVHGRPLNFVGEAHDAEGPIPCDRLRWGFRLGHNAHTHPITQAIGCTASFLFSVPPDHLGTGGVFLAVELVATDDGAPGVPPLTGRMGIRLNVAPPPVLSPSGAFLAWDVPW
jgi:glucose/arabinose dehydrogenase/type 1 glutamine amidotransferase